MNEKQQGRKTILIVEDDADIGSVLFHLLADETSYDIVLVTHPGEALAIITEITPVLVIFNYQLPEMNGIELFDQLRRLPHLTQVPAVMVSATLPWKEINERGIRGIDKPFDLDGLLALVHTLTG